LINLDSLFELKKHNSSVRVESIGGMTTFLAMVYITVVNPSILSEAGMDFGAVFVATCIAAAFGSIVMGLHANYPIAQAPGMGQNAFFTFGVVLGMGHSWQTALGAVFISGMIFVATWLPASDCFSVSLRSRMAASLWTIRQHWLDWARYGASNQSSASSVSSPSRPCRPAR